MNRNYSSNAETSLRLQDNRYYGPLIFRRDDALTANCDDYCSLDTSCGGTTCSTGRKRSVRINNFAISEYDALNDTALDPVSTKPDFVKRTFNNYSGRTGRGNSGRGSANPDDGETTVNYIRSRVNAAQGDESYDSQFPPMKQFYTSEVPSLRH